MGKTDQERAQQNAANRAQGNKWKKIGEDRQKEFDKQQAKLERLKEAKTQLDKKLANFDDFQNEVNDYPDKIDQTKFKGSREKKVEDKFGDLTDTLHDDKNHYQSAEKDLDAEITKLAFSQGDLGTMVSSAFNTAEDFFKSIF